MYKLKMNGKTQAKSESYEALYNYATNNANCTIFAGQVCTIEDEFGTIDTFQVAPIVAQNVLHVMA